MKPAINPKVSVIACIAAVVVLVLVWNCSGALGATPLPLRSQIGKVEFQDRGASFPIGKISIHESISQSEKITKLFPGLRITGEYQTIFCFDHISLRSFNIIVIISQTPSKEYFALLFRMNINNTLSCFGNVVPAPEIFLVWAGRSCGCALWNCQKLVSTLLPYVE